METTRRRFDSIIARFAFLDLRICFFRVRVVRGVVGLPSVVASFAISLALIAAVHSS